jgi:hypothetical protein
MVRQVFLQDLGENHLENIVVSDNDVDLSLNNYQVYSDGLFPSESSSKILHLYKKNTGFFQNTRLFVRKPAIGPLGLRAPPIVA